MMIMFIIFISVVLGWYSSLQTISEVYVDEGLKRSLISFASARAISGVISVVQGTAVSIQPMGIGLNMTIGQVLSPINDLLNAFSAVMLATSVAFGIQKLLLLVGSNWIVSTILSISAFVWGLLWMKGRSPDWLSRLLGLMIFIRFAMPVVIIGSNFIFAQFSEQQYVAAQNSLSATANDVLKLQLENGQNNNQCSVWNLMCKFENAVGNFSVENLKSKYEHIKTKLETIVEKIITLAVIFLMQTIVIPLILVLCLYRLSFSLVLHQDAVVFFEKPSS